MQPKVTRSTMPWIFQNSYRETQLTLSGADICYQPYSPISVIHPAGCFRGVIRKHILMSNLRLGI